MEYSGSALLSPRVIDGFTLLENLFHYDVVVEELAGTARIKAKSLSVYPDLEGYVSDVESDDQWLDVIMYMLTSIGEEDGYREERA
jgi:hypothetical protein